MDAWIVEIVAMGACMLALGIASGIETALVGLPAARVQFAIEKRIAGARHLLVWLRRPAHILVSLLWVRSASTLGVGALTCLLVRGFNLDWLATVGVCAGVMLLLMLMHVLPRSLGKRFSLEVGTKTMGLVFVIAAVTWPFIWPFFWLGRGLSHLLGLSPERSGPFWTPDEIGRLTTDANAASLGEDGEDLFLSMIEFSDTVIREIMVPRTEMIGVSLSSTHGEVQQVVLEAGHSRIPVYDDTIDNIVGVLHVKDLFIHQIRTDGRNLDLNLRMMLRPTFYVPEVMKISELLREFQRRKTHMAIVVDEYGGTAGVVTLEDIIEEIVGEIQDEYDVEEKQFRMLGEKIIADGRVSIWDLEEALSVEFPNDAGYETLAGFLMSRTGSLPQTGMIITWNNLRFTIKEANEKRIGMVEIDRQAAVALASI